VKVWVAALGLPDPRRFMGKGKVEWLHPAREASAPATDEDLVEAILGGDESAFEALYERYFPRIYRFVDRRTRNRSDTEELTQEVFANLFASLSSFRREAPFAAWVFGVTRRTIAARFKRSATRP